MKSIRTELSGFSKFLPEKRVTNDDLSKVMDTNDKWIVERTGIRERRFVDKSTKSSDLAIGAVQKTLDQKNLSPSDFDFIIASTLSPDYYFPGVAPIVQDKLGFGPIPALDIRVQCSAFVYSVQLADSLLKSRQYKRILLVFTDVQSKLLDLSTRGRNVSVLFADGAAAVVCEAVECDETELPTVKNNVSGVIDTILGADGSGTELLALRVPGTAHPTFIDHESIDEGLCSPKMEGQAVFKNAVARMSEVAETLMQKHNLSADDIDYLIPHQANMRISEYVRTKIGIPPEKVFNNIECYGNTTSATIPICITEALEEGKLKKGSLILTVAFGAGFTWGGSLIRI